MFAGLKYYIQVLDKWTVFAPANIIESNKKTYAMVFRATSKLMQHGNQF